MVKEDRQRKTKNFIKRPRIPSRFHISSEEQINTEDIKKIYENKTAIKQRRELTFI